MATKHHNLASTAIGIARRARLREYDPIDHVEGPIRPGQQGEVDIMEMKMLALAPLGARALSPKTRPQRKDDHV